MTQNILGWLGLQENIRHNKVTEAIGYGNLYETGRHNLASESIGMAQIGLGYSQLMETSRHNQQQEALAWSKFPYETYLLSSQSGKYNADIEYTQANKDWVMAKTDETKANTNLIEVNTVRSVFGGIKDVLNFGLLILK